ncbi:hypothetical protein [Algoriphagus aquimarinus]|uniref:Uncharacterized protein n=1 Tax=Algoriphagus aquimarinus TaxID=237018 RepID=A0A1I0Y1K2_9BACT|nr:hypothetical protein [Algoriphagus aquimarinus]SFB07239.1 hypothetical protein SAMN04489723_10467 [Algoriphagus aquimarinus]
MKKIIVLAIVFLAMNQISHAQTQKGVKVSDIDKDYIELLGVSKLLSTKVKVLIDYGQPDDFWSSKDTQLIDDDGTPIIFESIMGAINYFSSHGYEFVNAYAITLGNQNVYHYMMRKKLE